MNKTAIKNFAIWARNKLIADISYKAGLLGVTEKGIKSPLPQSTQTVQFFDIGTKEPSSITGIEIQQRKKLVEEIERKAKQSDYTTAYKNVIEEVAYTWFNRLVAIRFMEVNDYLPTRIRVLSSESNGKAEPDLVTHALEANLDYSAYEKDRIIQLKHENKLDELFRMLFIKQCNALNANLPELFEKTNDYTELLLNVSFTDKEGVVYHLVNDISENDFNVTKEGQVEIIGWLYQYYNTEPKAETFALLKKNVKITKERIPAATQLFTPDWIVRYMVENSLGRLWLEGHPNDELKSNWKYYLDEAEQEDGFRKQLNKIREEYKSIKPEDIKVIDPAMGSGHILVYAFDVLMQIYESYGYSQRDAATSIIENNLYGLDIDNRAYQLAYFAVMMKARQHNRRILDGAVTCHIHSMHESNQIERNMLKYFGMGFSDIEKNSATLQMQGLIDDFSDAKELGSLIKINKYDWNLLHDFINNEVCNEQLSIDLIGLERVKKEMSLLIDIGKIIVQKYDVVITNPPYAKRVNLSKRLNEFIAKNYEDSKQDLFSAFIEKSVSNLKQHGFCSMITQSSFLFKSHFKYFRKKIYSIGQFVNIVKLGSGAFEEIQGEVVQSVLFTLRRSRNTSPYNFTYVDLFRIKGAKEKEYEYTINKESMAKEILVEFQNISSDYLIINSNINIYKKVEVNSKIGCQPGSNLIFNWWEINKGDPKYVPYNKGGTYRKWYGNLNWVLKFGDRGSSVVSNGGQLSNQDYYFRDHISWTRVSSRLNMRFYDRFCLFDNTSPAIFNDLFYLLGYYNSVVCENERIEVYGANKIESGYINALAPIDIDIESRKRVEELVRENISISMFEWNSYESSWAFREHPFISCMKQLSSNGYEIDLFSSEFDCSLKEIYDLWHQMTYRNFSLLKNNEEEINRIFINSYSLEDELNQEVLEKDITIRTAELTTDIKSFISYSVGCMLGRYSLDVEGLAFAGGDWDEAKYKTLIPDCDNIIPITDEQYFQDDIVGRFVEFVKVVYGTETLEANLDFISNAIGGKGKSSREIIRNYFLKDFYKDHCQVYHRKPIYWLFDSGKKNGFKALIYMHRYDENTIGNLRIDYLHRMQRIYENEIARMQDTIENSRDAREVTAATKNKEKLIKQLQETKEYDEKIAHLALTRTPIDLDDGVKVNYEKVQTDRDGKKLDVLAKI